VKRTQLALTLIFAFSILVMAGSQTPLAKANCFPLPDPSISVSILSPIDGGKYFQNQIPLKLSISASFTSVNRVTYRLDSQADVEIDPDTTAVVTVPNDGWHVLTVTATGQNGQDFTKGVTSVTFFVDAVPPSITIFSPKNETYTTRDVPLNFTASELVEWMGYSLDGQSTVVLNGEFASLAGLSYGSHSITVYANDTVGRLGTSDTVYFTITQETEKVPEGQPEPFSTTLAVAVASGGSIAAVAAGAVVYSKKRNRGSSS
jgi:hypothetical protein